MNRSDKLLEVFKEKNTIRKGWMWDAITKAVDGKQCFLFVRHIIALWMRPD